MFIFTDISDLKSTKNARLSTMTTTIKDSFYILEDVELQGTTAVKIKTLTFPEGTTIVGNSFSDSEFTSVTFPDTLITIQDKSLSIKDIMRPARYVPDSIPVDKLLKQLRTEGNSIAVVVNEYGGTTGIVTVEDILKKLWVRYTTNMIKKKQALCGPGKTDT